MSLTFRTRIFGAALLVGAANAPMYAASPAYEQGLRDLAKHAITDTVESTAVYCHTTDAWTDVTAVSTDKRTLAHSDLLFTISQQCPDLDVYHTHPVATHLGALLTDERLMVGWAKDRLIRPLPGPEDLPTSVVVAETHYRFHTQGTLRFGVVTGAGIPDTIARTERNITPYLSMWELDSDAVTALRGLIMTFERAANYAMQGIEPAVKNYVGLVEEARKLVGEGSLVSLEDVCGAASDATGFTFTCGIPIDLQPPEITK